MAMATEEDMEISVGTLDTKQRRDFNFRKCVVIDTQQYRNANTKRISMEFSLQQGLCLYCSKIIAFSHTCESSLCILCYLRLKKYQSRDELSFQQSTALKIDEKKLLSMFWDKFSRTLAVQSTEENDKMEINSSKPKNVELAQMPLESFKSIFNSVNTSSISPNFVQVTTELTQPNENYENIPNPGSNTTKQNTNSQEGTGADHANDKNNSLARPQSNKLLKWNKRSYRKRYINQIKSIRWPSKIKTNGGKMGRMSGIGYRMDGIWAAADCSNNTIHVCGANNELIMIFGCKGKAINQFNCPFGVTFDDAGCLYVSEYGNHRVQKFDPNFEYMLHFGEEGENDGQLIHPMGIVAYKNKVYVADSANSRVAVFSTDGTFYCNIVGGCLHNPCDVTISNKSHRLFITDSCSIHVYSLEGENCYISSFTDFGPGRSHLTGLALASNDHFIFVANGVKHQICVLNKSGKYVYSFGNNKGHVRFNRPQGVAFSSNGKTLLVSDHGNQRIMLFSV